MSFFWLFLQVREHPQRASRILLDIEAGAPVILIPESSQSLKVLVANLGRLRVQNSFSLRDKVERHTQSHQRCWHVSYPVVMCDCVSLSLSVFQKGASPEHNAEWAAEVSKLQLLLLCRVHARPATRHRERGNPRGGRPSEFRLSSFRSPKLYTTAKHQDLIKTLRI